VKERKMNDWKVILLDISPVAIPALLSLFSLYLALTCVSLNDFVRNNPRGGWVYLIPIVSFLIMGIGYIYLASIMPSVYRGINLGMGICLLFLAFMTIRDSIPDYIQEF